LHNSVKSNDFVTGRYIPSSRLGDRRLVRLLNPGVVQAVE
jgi:hypothetical protein